MVLSLCLLFCFAFFTFLEQRKRGQWVTVMQRNHRGDCFLARWQCYILTMCCAKVENRKGKMLTDQHFSAAQQQSSCLVLNPSSFPQHNDPWEQRDRLEYEIKVFVPRLENFKERKQKKLTDWPFEALFVLRGCCPHIWELCFQEPIHPSCDGGIRESRIYEDKSFRETSHSGVMLSLPAWGLSTGFHSPGIYFIEQNPFVCA